MTYNPEKHHRKSIRLKEYNYKQTGLYFITICSYHKEKIFGKIGEKGMLLNCYGKIAKKFWLEIPGHFPNVHIMEFVLMPNHLHGIIRLDDVVGIRHAVSLQLNVMENL